MKIFGPKSLSQYLFYTARLLTIVSGINLLLLSYAITTESFITVGNQLRIELPIMGLHLEILNESNIPIMLMASTLFYSIFFYSLSEVFKTFSAEKLFTQQVQKTLVYFAILNVLTPIAYVVVHSLIIQDMHFIQLPYALLHLVLGIIVFFITELLKQGKQLQTENDLTI